VVVVSQRRSAGVAGVPRGGSDSPGPASAGYRRRSRRSTVGSIAAAAPPRCVYAAAAATVAVLIYISGGGTANSIMFWWRDELKHTHTREGERRREGLTRVRSFFIPLRTPKKNYRTFYAHTHTLVIIDRNL